MTRSLVNQSVFAHVLDYIEQLGVRHVFAVPGAPLTALFSALQERSITTVLARHESGAVFMADGYARVAQRPGVCIATSGPGVLNAAAGMSVARADGIPVLLLSGEVPMRSWGHGALQESGPWGLDGVEALRAVCGRSLRVASTEMLRPALRDASATLLGAVAAPVHIAIPADIGGSFLRENIRAAASTSALKRTVESLDEILQPLSGRRVALLLGHGCARASRESGASALAELLDATVFCTPKAKGLFPESSPRFGGVVGFGGSDAVWNRFVSTEFDALLVVGSSLGDLQTNGWDRRVVEGRTFVHVDANEAVMGRTFSPTTAVTMRAEELFAFAKTAVRCGAEPTGEHRTPMLVSQDETLTLDVLTRHLSAIADTDAHFFVDAGNVAGWSIANLQLAATQRFFINLGAGCMGHSIGAAVGGAFANPERRAYVLVGDAAFAMFGSEVHVAAEHDLPITFIVANDGGHGMIEHGERLLGNVVSPTRFRHPIDARDVGRGYGLRSHIVRTPQEIDAVLRAQSQGPELIDARVTPLEVPAALATRAANVQRMIRASQIEKSP